MSSTFVVPPDVGVFLHGALYAELARAGSDIEQVCSLAEPGDVSEPITRLRRLAALLDDIGWRVPGRPGPLAIERRHTRTVVDTLRDDQEGWEYFAAAPRESLETRERAATRARKIAAFLATLPVPMALMVPPGLIASIREGAVELARDVGEAIDNGESLRGCSRRLAAIAALVDALDAAEPDTMFELDGEHGEMLRQAVAVMLPLMEQWASELTPTDPSHAERADELRLMRHLAAQVVRAMGDGERG